MFKKILFYFVSFVVMGGFFALLFALSNPPISDTARAVCALWAVVSCCAYPALFFFDEPARTY
jgi:amino acid permease